MSIRGGYYLLLLSLGIVNSGAAAVVVNLGTADAFAVLAGSTVTNTGPTTIYGDLGVWPGLAITGFPPGTVSGAMHSGDLVAMQAQADLTTAYVAAASQPCVSVLTGQDLGGLTLTTGVYCFASSAQLTGTLTLNAQGNPNAVFIFQIGSTLTTASSSAVVLTNGGEGNKVFFQVGSSATLGTNTSFEGNILALASITLNTGATIACGSALARNGAVTLDTNVVNGPGCDASGGGAVPEPGTAMLFSISGVFLSAVFAMKRSYLVRSSNGTGV